MALPDIDDLFTTYFGRWYDEDDQERKGFKHTRPDVMRRYKPGTPVADVCPLTEEYRTETEHRVRRMLRSAIVDWPTFLPLAEPVDSSWVELFDEHYTAETVADLIAESSPDDFCNSLLVSTCQLGAVLGHVLQGMLPRLEWLWDWPYWESRLYDPVSGNEIPPFHWAMKKFSDYAIDDGLEGKMACCIHILNEGGKDS